MNITDKQGYCAHGGVSCDVAEQLAGKTLPHSEGYAEPVEHAGLETEADADAWVADLKGGGSVDAEAVTREFMTLSVPVPDGYNAEDKRVFRADITKSLEAIVKDAISEVAHDRTWRDA